MNLCDWSSDVCSSDLEVSEHFTHVHGRDLNICYRACDIKCNARRCSVDKGETGVNAGVGFYKYK